MCTFIVDFNRTWDFCQIFSMKLFSICFPVSWLSKYKWFFFTPIFVKISNLDYAVNWKVFPQTQRYCTRNVEIPWNERDWNQSVLVAFNIDLISKNQPTVFSVYQQSAIFFKFRETFPQIKNDIILLTQMVVYTGNNVYYTRFCLILFVHYSEENIYLDIIISTKP